MKWGVSVENKFSGKYHEHYAMLSLEHCYNSDWNVFDVTKESPDLQSCDLDVGIEVTRAIISHDDGIAKTIAGTYFGKGLSTEDISDAVEKYFPKFGGELGSAGGCTFISHTKGIYDFESHKLKLTERIKSKTYKLNGNYKIFQNNHLYIFTGSGLFEKEDVIAAVAVSNEEIKMFDKKYDLYFVNCIDKLFVVDRASMNIQEITIDESILKRIKTDALACVET